MAGPREPAFGAIIKERRHALDLTQAELARRVACATITIRKIEADDLRPSQQIAERLAMALNVPLDKRADFVQSARAAFLADHSPLPTSPTPTPQEIGQEDLSGRAIRGYELGERLGNGSFGAVYRAVQPLLEREVAVKIILPQYADHPEFIRRFEAEAQLVARLEHPYIVPLYDYWREPGVAYLVMRFLRGGSLKDRLESGPLDLATAGRLLEQVGAALHAAHRVGVVHRDLKPANVLLDEEGNGYLADFGIAKNLSDPQMADVTQAGAILGSPAYASPEQILSDPVQPQTDIYALGILLYELLAGELPFHGPTPLDYVQQHLNQSVPSLAAYPALDSVVRRATAKRPVERYPDIPALLADFRQALQPGGGVLAPVPHAVEVGSVALENPYKGLRPFGEADAADFFGRDTLVQELLGALGEAQDDTAGPRQELARFLAVVGPSGSGKSSVVQAGLLPALRRGGLPGSEQWFIVDLQPGMHPWEELEAALLRIAVNPPESLLAQLQEGPRGLLRAARRILPADPAVELVLVIDQFEELFTQVTDEEVRAAFLAGLVTAALEERSRLRIVITLRADFVGRALEYVDFGELLRQRTAYVLPLTPEELEQAIVGPAGRAGAAVEPGLLAAVVQDVGDQPGMLPLLQYALTELFERRAGRAMTLAAYRESGGVAGALGRRAEELYAQLDEGGREAARQLFLRLVTLGEGSADTRRRVLQAEVEGVLGPHPSPPAPSPLSPNGERGEGVPPSRSPERAAAGERGEGQPPTLPLATCYLPPASPMSPVLALYGRYRLLTFDHDPLTRGPTVEVAHEALLREWGRLRGWLESSRADVRLERMLGAAAGEWEGAGREPSYLLQGARLSQFAGWAAGSTLALTAGEREYLAASVAEREVAENAEKERRERELQTALQLAKTEKGRAEEQSKRAEAEKQRAETAQQLAETEKEKAAEQGRNARRLRQRAVWLGAALVVAAVLAALALFFGQSANNSAQEAGRSRDAAQTAQVQAVAEAGVRATAQAVAETQQAVALAEADARAAAEAEALASLNRSEAMRLAGEANQLLLKGDDPTLVALLALRSLALEYTPQGDAALEGAARLDYPARLITTTSGESSYSVAWSPDGRYLATGGSGNGNVHLWDAATGAEVRRFTTTYSIGVNPLAFSPDSRFLAAAGTDEVMFLWDVASGREVRRITSTPYFGFSFSPDGQYITTGSAQGVQVVDIASGQVERTFDPALPPDGGLFAPDGHSVWIVSRDGERQQYDVYQGDLGTGAIVETTTHFSGATGIALLPDGQTVLVVLWKGDTVLLDLATGVERQRFAHPGGATGFALSPDGRFLAVNTQDSVSLVWDVVTGVQLRRFIHPAMVLGAAFSPDGQILAAVGGAGAIRLWELVPQAGLPRFPPQPDMLDDLAFSPDGRLIATASWVGSSGLWDARTGARLGGFAEGTMGVDFSPDGRMVATGGCYAEGCLVQLWDVSTVLNPGAGPIPEIRRFAGHTGSIFEVAFSPDGQTLVSIAGNPDETARLWDVATGAERVVIDLRAANAHVVVFSPNGDTVLISSGTTSRATLWDAATGKRVREFVPGAGEGLVEGIAYSPDGRFITAAGGDGVVWMWDAQTGAVVRQFRGHTSEVSRAVFSADGRYLLTSSLDDTVRLWDVASGQELRRFAGFTSSVYGVDFAPDGRVIAMNSLDGTMWLSYLDIHDTIDSLCSLLLRDLTAEERAQYGVGEEATCPLEVAR